MKLNYEELACIAEALGKYIDRHPETGAAVSELADRIVAEQAAQAECEAEATA